MKTILYYSALLYLTGLISIQAQLKIMDQETIPHTLLQVNDEGNSGSITLNSVSSTLSGNKLYNLGGNLYWGLSLLGTAGSAGGWTDSGPKVYLSTLTDKVGIGTSTPARPLSFADAYGDKISIWGQTAGANCVGLGNQAGLFQLYTDGSHADIAFGYGRSESFVENMRIKGSGKVGIGTSTPQYGIQLHENSSTYSYIHFTNSTTGSDGLDGVLVGIDPNEDFRIHTYENNDIKFYINNIERARIENNGDVGIGTASPDAKLDVNGDVKLGSNGLIFNEIREISGTTAATGDHTSISYPSGYNKSNTRVLCCEVNLSGSTWVGIGLAELTSGISFTYSLLDSDIRLLYHASSGFQDTDYRLILMRVD